MHIHFMANCRVHSGIEIITLARRLNFDLALYFVPSSMAASMVSIQLEVFNAAYV